MDIGIRDEILSMDTSDQQAAESCKYCGEKPSLIKKESCTDGNREETEHVSEYLQDER